MLRAALVRQRPLLGKRTLPRLILPPDDDGLVQPSPPVLEDTETEHDQTAWGSEDVLMLDVNLGLKACPCPRGCIANLTVQNKTQAENMRQALTGHDKHSVMFNLVKEAGNANKTWRLFGKEICRTAFLEITGVSKKLLGKIESAIANGNLQPWEDQRKYNGSNITSMDKQMDIDAFFCFLYQYLAEPLADADQACQELLHQGHGARIHEWVQARDGNVLAQASAGLREPVDRRYLPHMTWKGLYDMYILFGDLDSNGNSAPKAKRKCFDAVFKNNWALLLGIRQAGQHARCNTCATLTKLRREHPDENERAAAGRAYKEHLNRMFDDRRVDMRLTRLSELSTSMHSSFAGCLHVRIDGMDQSKFKVPRNIEDAKMWSSLWRPTLHLCGVVVEGVLELYLAMDADVAKDSNMEATALSIAMDRTYKILQGKSLPMPEHLSVKFDNTGREGKNQHITKYLAWLTATGKFRSTQDGQGEKGHTHDALDQRFAVISTVLSHSQVLQTPAEFMRVIANQVQPCRGRVLQAEILDATWDWQDFFDPFGLKLSGIAASPNHPDTCHSKRFLTRPALGCFKLQLCEFCEMQTAHFELKFRKQ